MTVFVTCNVSQTNKPTNHQPCIHTHCCLLLLWWLFWGCHHPPMPSTGAPFRRQPSWLMCQQVTLLPSQRQTLTTSLPRHVEVSECPCAMVSSTSDLTLAITAQLTPRLSREPSGSDSFSCSVWIPSGKRCALGQASHMTPPLLMPTLCFPVLRQLHVHHRARWLHCKSSTTV